MHSMMALLKAVCASCGVLKPWGTAQRLSWNRSGYLISQHIFEHSMMGLLKAVGASPDISPQVGCTHLDFMYALCLASD